MTVQRRSLQRRPRKSIQNQDSNKANSVVTAKEGERTAVSDATKSQWYVRQKILDLLSQSDGQGKTERSGLRSEWER